MTDLGISKLVLAMQLNGFICYIPNSNSLFTHCLRRNQKQRLAIARKPL